MPPVLQLRDMTKAFPGVLANDHIDLALEEGEIHALLGENGAGKTTLMNILYGLYTPDEGQVLIRGEEVEIHSPSDAIARGIGMVHQHFMLVPVMTVTENVMLGVESTRNGVFLDRAEVARCILDSLAASAVQVIEQLAGFLGAPIPEVCIVGGGSQNRLLNRLIEERSGLPVRTGSPEATALGNALLKALALGYFGDLDEARLASAGPEDPADR